MHKLNWRAHHKVQEKEFKTAYLTPEKKNSDLRLTFADRLTFAELLG